MKKTASKYTFDHVSVRKTASRPARRHVWVSTSDRNVGKCVTPAVLPQP